jgi:hypothetical protein
MRIGVVALLALVLAVVACGSDGAAPDAAPPEPGENPHPVATAGRNPSLAYIAGRPAIAYYRDLSQSLHFAMALNEAPLGEYHWEGYSIDASADVGSFAALTEADGHGVIAYYDATNTALKVAITTEPVPENSSDWHHYTVDDDGDVGQFVSIGYASFTAAQTEHRLAIAYYDATAGDLKIAYARTAAPASAGDWTIVAVDSADDVGKWTSIAVAPRNGFSIAAAYYGVTNSELRFAMSVDGDDPTTPDDWAVDWIQRGGDAGTHTDIAYAPRNPLGAALPRWFISYRDIDGADLRFAIVEDAITGLEKDVHIVDSDGDVGAWSSIAVVDAMPVIAYLDATNGAIRLARGLEAAPRATDQWEIETLAGDVGANAGFTSMALPPCGPEDTGDFGRVEAAVAYVDAAAGEIRFAYDARAAGSWYSHRVHEAPRALRYGTVLADDGRAAIVYGDPRAGTLEVARARVDAPGRVEDWGTEVIHTGVDPIYVSAAIVDGRVVAAFFDRVTQTLRFRGAPSGSEASHVVADRGKFATMALIGGNPTVAYFDEPARALRLARASSPLPGSTAEWTISDIATDIGIADGVSLAELDGAPIVHYADDFAGYYAAANVPEPASPADWTVHDMGIPSSTTVTPSRLIVTGGRPAVVHRDANRLAFALASTPTPQSAADWNDYLVHASDGSGYEIAAAVAGDVPVIAHWFGPPSGATMRVATATIALPASIEDWNNTVVVPRITDQLGVVPFGIVDEPRTVAFSSQGCLVSAYPR